MLETYESVGLMPNREKSFRDELKTSFWGADVDGSRGQVRGSLKRALPLVNLIIKIVNVGCGTVDLLQTVTGCIISLFLYRRRFLSVLDSIFESYRGRGGREVVVLNGRVKTDLLVVATLSPLAVANLRSKPPDRIYASDASSWGEAAVHAEISPVVGAELLRHTLRKSIWVRLLAPAAAWERAHGLLDAAFEVPDEEEAYQSNPLWESLARSLDKLTFAKAKQAPRHINIGEVRGALKAEKLGALRRPESRILVGLDSQVSLGALIKGRSASPGLNNELARSLPHMVLLDYSADYFYYHTKFNPADDPTRGKMVRAAEVDRPTWWKEAEKGNFDQLDRWLRIYGLDDYTVSGLPKFEELETLEKEGFTAGILPRTVEPEADCGFGVQERDAELKDLPLNEGTTEFGASTEAENTEAGGLTEAETGSEPVDIAVNLEEDGDEGSSVPALGNAEDAPRDRSDGSAHPVPQKPGSRGRIVTGAPEGSGSGTGKAPSEKREPRSYPGTKSPEERKRGARLSSRARRILESFPRDQFVLPSGVAGPPQEAGFLDLFSGERGVAEEAAKLGVWSLCFDLEHGPAEDLRDKELQARIEEAIRAGCFSSLGGGPVCSSFSMAITPPVRSAEWPYGKPNLFGSMDVRVTAPWTGTEASSLAGEPCWILDVSAP